MATSYVTFQDWVWLEELVLDVLTLPGVAGDGSDVLHHQLARLGLPGAALPREDDGLVLSPGLKLVPRPIRQGVAATRNKFYEWMTSYPGSQLSSCNIVALLTYEEESDADSGFCICQWHPGCRGTASCTGWCSPGEWRQMSARNVDIMQLSGLISVNSHRSCPAWTSCRGCPAPPPRTEARGRPGQPRPGHSRWLMAHSARLSSQILKQESNEPSCLLRRRSFECVSTSILFCLIFKGVTFSRPS